jgi:hypothetical protein
MSATSPFLFGTAEDFGVAGYRTDSVESFIRDAAEASVRSGRVPWPAPTLSEADASFASMLSGNYGIEESEGFLGEARFTHVGLCSSDHFMHDRRMMCGGYDRPSPLAMWNELASGEGKTWGRVVGCGRRFAKTDRLDEGFLRAVTRLSGGCYNAAQFKPAVAAAVIRFFGAASVLDPCAGWGDRLAAACACGVRYLGVDPNGGNFDGYAGIIGRYGKEGRQEVVESCFEDFDAGESQFDLAFTSPPYFDTERYAAGTEHEPLQSWRRYETVDAWVEGFLQPMVAGCQAALKTGGVLAVNLKDSIRKTASGKATLGLCDRLERECVAAGMERVGVIAMQMKSAPGNVPAHRPAAGKAMIEPIICYRRR